MSKRLPFGLAASVLLAATLAGGVVSAAGPKDRVTGSATFDIEGGSHARVSAQSDADGANPRGTYRIREPGSDINNLAAEVTCLSVDGNQAVVGARVTRSDPAYWTGEWLLHYIDDGGTPGTNDASITVIGLLGPADCSTPLSAWGATLEPVMHGNWRVRDRD